jgi:hypothetical protein
MPARASTTQALGHGHDALEKPGAWRTEDLTGLDRLLRETGLMMLSEDRHVISRAEQQAAAQTQGQIRLHFFLI